MCVVKLSSSSDGQKRLHGFADGDQGYENASEQCKRCWRFGPRQHVETAQEVQQAAVGQKQQQPIRQRVTQQHRQDDNATLSQAAAGEVPSRSPPLFSVPGGFGAHAKVPTKMRETITARYSPNQLNHKYANSPTLSHDPNSTNKEQTNYLDRAVPKAKNDSRHYLADTSAKGAFNPDDHPTAQVTQQRHSYNPPTGHSSGTTEARERMKRIKTDPRSDYQAYTRPQGVSQQNNRKPPMSQLSKVDDNAGMYDEEDPSAIQTFGFDQAGDEYAIESIHSGFLNVGHEPESDGAGSTLFHHVEDEGFTDTNLGIEPDLASRKVSRRSGNSLTPA